MCYHKQQSEPLIKVAAHYSVKYSDATRPLFQARHHESGFQFLPSAVVTAGAPEDITMANWGLIPWWTKTLSDAMEIRGRTLNCISEEMESKPSYRDAVKHGKRCLIPCTGFYEWHWLNNGKHKYPFLIRVKSTKLFSLGGLYSEWTDPETGAEHTTYTVLTTSANAIMEKIHNSKKRMPVIIEKGCEQDWLEEKILLAEVKALCRPYRSPQMEAWPISKMITDRKVANKNVADIESKFEYPELSLEL